MTTGRKKMVYTILLGILLGHFFCLVVGAELWPFSRYPMYAKASNSEEGFRQWEVVGVPIRGGEEEAFILPAAGLPRSASLHAGINRLLRARTEEKPMAEERIQNALIVFADMYYRHQEADKEDLIPLREIRLYRRTWVKGPRPGPLTWEEEERELEAWVTIPPRLAES